MKLTRNASRTIVFAVALAATLFLLVLVSGQAQPAAASLQPSAPPATPAPDQVQIATALQSAPVMFVENVGQFDSRARFQAHGGNATLHLADDAIWLTVLEHPQGDAAQRKVAGPERIDENKDKPRKGVNLKQSFAGATLTRGWNPLTGWIRMSRTSSATTRPNGSPTCQCGAACATWTFTPALTWRSPVKADAWHSDW